VSEGIRFHLQNISGSDRAEDKSSVCNPFQTEACDQTFVRSFFHLLEKHICSRKTDLPSVQVVPDVILMGSSYSVLTLFGNDLQLFVHVVLRFVALV
jgi:hypothetical protein